MPIYGKGWFDEGVESFKGRCFPDTSAMLGTRYRRFAALSEGGPMLLRCGTLHSATQCCAVSHSATAWVRKSGIADVSSSRDAQITWEDDKGNSMTQVTQ